MVWEGHDGDFVGCVIRLGLVAGREKMEGATDMVTRERDHETDQDAC
jgi:hypothetical protein